MAWQMWANAPAYIIAWVDSEDILFTSELQNSAEKYPKVVYS